MSFNLGQKTGIEIAARTVPVALGLGGMNRVARALAMPMNSHHAAVCRQRAMQRARLVLDALEAMPDSAGTERERRALAHQLRELVAQFERTTITDVSQRRQS